MWVFHLGLIIHLRLSKSLVDYLKMNLHASIAYNLRLLKSLKGYIETNLNMGIAFRETQKYIYL